MYVKSVEKAKDNFIMINFSRSEAGIDRLGDNNSHNRIF